VSHPHHRSPTKGLVTHRVHPEEVGWRYLGYEAVLLREGEAYTYRTEGREAALVPLQGRARLEAGGDTYHLSRSSVFAEKPHILYLPPGHDVTVEAESDFAFAVGSAPAEGRYPKRLFLPDEMRVEVRGGGPAKREVHHVLSHPLPAERLILFEVYVPGGMWSGWPPHRHNARGASPYLEETYHYRFGAPHGFGLHRNYDESGFGEVFAVQEDDLVLVTRGYHPVAASPGSTMYFLNYLAGELQDEARATPPQDDPHHAWVKDDWDAASAKLPLME
jgi:5-deoxy-glucuronate isomerase